MPHRLTWAITISASILVLGANGGGGVARAANTAADVCQRWVCDRADISEGMSTGSVATCAVGDLLPPGRPNSLKLVNLYRFLAGMPAVTEDPNFDTMAQECAIIQAANSITHTPATTAACYNAAGATASNRSSICSGQSVGCIDLYMNDANGGGPGFGHRQWIFANALGPVGFGSVGTGRGMTGSCFYQVGGTARANIPWVAWPPSGPIPVAAITTTNVDKAGWSIQSDTINFAGATATVMDGTTNQPITVATGLPSFGAKFAMSITPMGWTEQAGHNYAVSISGITTPISYTIQVQDCAGVTTATCAAGGTGGTTGTTGAGGATGTGGTTGGTGGGAGSAATTGSGGGTSTGGGAGSTGPAGAAGSSATGNGGMTGSPAGPGGNIAVEKPVQGGCACSLPGGRGQAGLAAGLVVAVLGLALALARRRRRV